LLNLALLRIVQASRLRFDTTTLANFPDSLLTNVEALADLCNLHAITVEADNLVALGIGEPSLVLHQAADWRGRGRRS
jgi:hypothetical protein